MSSLLNATITACSSNSLDVRLTCKFFFITECKDLYQYNIVYHRFEANDSCILLFISVSDPMVFIASNPTNSIRLIGSTVFLTCIVELSSVLDVPVIVNTEWTGPAGFEIINTAQPAMGSSTTYISTTMVSSFGREQSGAYACTVITSSISPYLNNSDPQRTTIGMLLVKCIPTSWHATIYHIYICLFLLHA